jgi:SAM-dependent methyltransferase
MRRPDFIAHQARHPTGLLGRLIARVMESETAEVNRRAAGLLSPRSQDQVLDIGTGHGRTLALLAASADQGQVVGIDHSPVMCARAARNNRTLIARDRVRIEQASSKALPFGTGTFDAALSVHTIYFWDPAEPHLAEIARVLRPGGRFVLAFRPAGAPGTEQFPAPVYRFRSAAEVTALLGRAGFEVSLAPDSDAGAIVFLTAIRTPAAVLV